MLANIPRRRGKRNKPDESKWRQQKLDAVRPLLTARCAMPITFIGGICFIGIGVVLYVAANSASEHVEDYTNCTGTDTINVFDVAADNNTCTRVINLTTEFKGDILFQYGLDNFYQNSRKYLKSRNDIQLYGSLNETTDCEPLAMENVSGKLLPIVPCGIIANSMFNDTFELYYLPPNDPSDYITVPFSTENVIWKGERERKFRNPPTSNNKTLCQVFEGTVKPPNWRRETCNVGNDEEGRALENIDFIVWMKPAALPKFRKNYRTLNRTTGLFPTGLLKGIYHLKIAYNYPVSDFEGRKRFIIVQNGWLDGPKNPFLGIAYIIFGGFLIFVTALFLFFHCRQRVDEERGN